MTEYNFLKHIELTDFFKENLKNIKTQKDMEDIIKYRIGVEVPQDFSPGTTMGGLCSNQIPNEISSLLFTILEKQVRFKSYLEVGVNKGGTFYLMDSFLRAINPDFKYSVAVDKRMKLIGFDAYKEKYPLTKVVLGDSKRLQFDEKFGLILIDGDHTYDGVKADYLNYKKYSDTLVFHDIDILHKRTNVKKLWGEIKKEYEPRFTKEFLNNTSDFNRVLGIGVLVQKEPDLYS